MGSSATALVAGIVGANRLLGDPLSIDDLLLLAAELEGHADNTSAALLGGLTALSYAPERLVARRLTVSPSLRVAIATPQADVSTAAQRASLPSQVLLKDAALNIGRALLVVEALATADYQLLGEVMHDQLHQPYRRPAVPGVNEAWQAALENGAAAVAISGAGPSLIAFAATGHEAIALAMADAFARITGKPAHQMVLGVDHNGADVQPLVSSD
jgi:homoserine kinase